MKEPKTLKIEDNNNDSFMFYINGSNVKYKVSKIERPKGSFMLEKYVNDKLESQKLLKYKEFLVKGLRDLLMRLIAEPRFYYFMLTDEVENITKLVVEFNFENPLIMSKDDYDYLYAQLKAFGFKINDSYHNRKELADNNNNKVIVHQSEDGQLIKKFELEFKV